MAKSLKKKAKKASPKKAAKSASSRRKGATDTAEIKDFISFIAQSGLNEVNVETDTLKLHVKREATGTPYAPAAAMSVPPPAAAPAPPPHKEETKPVAPAEKPVADRTLEIKSPMVGTFYRSPNPKSSAFVSVGDKVSKGQVVCIIEAMKLFNEIESEVSGTIVKIVAENASPVEYDQPLFLVEPE